jgi:FkbM family methyltransferase
MVGTDSLSLRLQFLGSLMRLTPMGIRRFASCWERFYRSIGGGGYEDNEAVDSIWPSGEHGPVRNRRFGYKVFLDLRVFAERRTYFSGAYIQRELEYLFALIMRTGDQYVDIGANIGMTSLMASCLIGGNGRGLAFEPNPEVFTRLKRHFTLNHVSNIEAIPVALSNLETEMNLVVPSRFSGLGSLTPGQERAGKSFKVQAVRGHSYLDRLDPGKPTIIKIDVEGHEVKALSGIEQFLDRPELAMISEVSVPLLRRAGDTPESFYELVTKHGFRPFAFELERGRFRTALVIRAVDSFDDALPDNWCDFLFAKPGSTIYAERIAPLLTDSRKAP